MYLQPGNISIITVQTLTELNHQHTYKLSASNDFLLGIIPLAVDHKIDHKCPNAYNRVYIQRSTIFGMLKPVELENEENSKTP